MACHLDLSPHRFDQLFTNTQTQAGATEKAGGGAINLGELFKNGIQALGGNSNAAVLDREAHGDRGRSGGAANLIFIVYPTSTAGCCDPEFNRSFFGELQGIAHQVGQHLAKTVAVTKQ